MKKIISLLSIVCMLVSFNTYSQINVTVNSSECNQVGNIVVIPVTATIPANTDPLIALQGAISFSNPNIININGVTFTEVALANGSVIGSNVIGNLINFAWGGAPVVLGQTVTLFNINVPLIASGCTDVSFVSSNTAVIEFLTTSGVVAFTTTQGLLCDQPQIPNTVTANGEDITNTLTATMCREDGSIFIQADGDFVEGITYNTTSNVLNNLNGTFTLPENSTLTSFIVDINGINTCGNPNIIPVTVNVEDCSSPCDCIFSQGEIGGNSTIGCGEESFGIISVGFNCNDFIGSPITWNFGDDSEEEIIPYSFTEGILHTFGQEGIYTITASLEYTDPGSGEVCILSYEKTVEVINCPDPAELDITLGCPPGNIGDIISFPVFITANSNVTLEDIRGTIEFSDPSFLVFQGISSFPATDGLSNFSEVAPGQIVFSWNVSSSFYGYQVGTTASTLLFYVDVLLTGNGCTQFDLNESESGTTIEFIDSNNNSLNYTVSTCEFCSVTDCNEEPFIEPYWLICDGPNVCDLASWPIHVLDANGDAITIANGITFSWVSSNGDTSSGDVVDTVAGLNWTLTLTYPDGCIYTITYSQDCCDTNIHLEIDECPTGEELDQLTKYYTSIPKERSSNIDINSIERALEYYKNTSREECNPCEIGYVVLRVFDDNGDLITDFESIVWYKNGEEETGYENLNFRIGEINTEYTVTVTQLTNAGTNTCVYSDTIIYHCRVSSCSITTPQNLGCNFDGANFNLTWDEVPGAIGYRLWIAPNDCNCSRSTLGFFEETGTNTYQIAGDLSRECFKWTVKAICSDGSASEIAEACFNPENCSIIGKPEKPEENSLDIRTYPNPNRGEFSVAFNESLDSFTAEIYDFVGNQIFKKEYGRTNTFEVNLKGKPSGIYFVKVITEKGVLTERLIIE